MRFNMSIPVLGRKNTFCLQKTREKSKPKSMDAENI